LELHPLCKLLLTAVFENFSGVEIDRHWFSLMGTVLPFEIITYAI